MTQAVTSEFNNENLQNVYAWTDLENFPPDDVLKSSKWICIEYKAEFRFDNELRKIEERIGNLHRMAASKGISFLKPCVLVETEVPGHHMILLTGIFGEAGATVQRYDKGIRPASNFAEALQIFDEEIMEIDKAREQRHARLAARRIEGHALSDTEELMVDLEIIPEPVSP